MNPAQNITQEINRTMLQRNCSYGEASRLISEAYPDLVILVKASGASRRAIQFFNEKSNAPARQEARKKSAEFINELMEQGHSYDVAFKKVHQEHPELMGPSAQQFVKISHPKAGTQGGAQFANAEKDACPIGSPQYKRTFLLPAAAHEERNSNAHGGQTDRRRFRSTRRRSFPDW